METSCQASQAYSFCCNDLRIFDTSRTSYAWFYLEPCDMLIVFKRLGPLPESFLLFLLPKFLLKYCIFILVIPHIMCYTKHSF